MTVGRYRSLVNKKARSLLIQFLVLSDVENTDQT